MSHQGAFPAIIAIFLAVSRPVIGIEVSNRNVYYTLYYFDQTMFIAVHISI